MAAELIAHDALAAHLDVELNIDLDDLANPVQAAASALSSFVGALLPLVAILLLPRAWRLPVTVPVALAITGAASARIGWATGGQAVLRMLIGRDAGLALTYGIGHLFGAAIS